MTPRARADDPALEFRGVTFSYLGTPVLEDASFAIGRREFICIVGPNGGGKSTLLKLALGLLKPDAGAVRLFGESARRGRLRVGYMPQHLGFDPQFPVTVLDVVLMGRLGTPGGAIRRLGFYGASDRRAAMRALEETGLTDLAGRPFADLSGGERQRVLIARALACEPELLLLDEPMANVDTLVEARILEILHALHDRMGVVMVSHDLGFVSQNVERVVCVNRSVVTHPTEEITGETVREIYGGSRRMVQHEHVLSELAQEKERRDA